MTQRTLIDTSFPGADANPITFFTTIANRGALKQVSNVAESAVLTTACFASDDSGTVYPTAQWARILAAAGWTGGNFIDVLVRITSGSTIYVNWELAQGSTATALNWRTSNATSGSIATPTLAVAAASGDIFELQVSGQAFTVIHTPVSTGIAYQPTGSPFTDAGAHVTAGNAGLGVRTTSLVSAGIARWTSGDFLGGTSFWPLFSQARPSRNVLLRM